MLDARLGSLEDEVRRMLAAAAERLYPASSSRPASGAVGSEGPPSFVLGTESRDLLESHGLPRSSGPGSDSVALWAGLPASHEMTATSTAADQLHGWPLLQRPGQLREGRISSGTVESAATRQEVSEALREAVEEAAVELEANGLTGSLEQAAQLASSCPARRTEANLLVGSVSSLVSDATIAPDAALAVPARVLHVGRVQESLPAQSGLKPTAASAATASLPCGGRAEVLELSGAGSADQTGQLIIGSVPAGVVGGWSCISLAPNPTGHATAGSTAGMASDAGRLRSVSPLKPRVPGSVMAVQPVRRASPMRQRSAPQPAANAVMAQQAAAVPLSSPGRAAVRCTTSPLRTRSNAAPTTIMVQQGSTQPSQPMQRAQPHRGGAVSSSAKDSHPQVIVQTARQAAPQPMQAKQQPLRQQTGETTSRQQAAAAAASGAQAVQAQQLRWAQQKACITPSPTPPPPCGPPVGLGAGQWSPPCNTAPSGVAAPVGPGQPGGYAAVTSSPLRPSRLVSR